MKTKFSIIFLLFILNVFLSAQDIKVLSSTSSSIIIEYSPLIIDTTIFYHNGERLVSLNIKGTFTEYLENKINLPIREINIGVPSETGNTIQIISSEFSTLPGIYISKEQFYRDSITNNLNYLSSLKNQEHDIVTFGEFGLIRNLQVQTIRICPIQIDFSNNITKIFRKIVFSINYGKKILNTEEIKETFLKDVVINWEYAKYWGIVQNKLYKVISPVLTSGTWYRFEIPEEGIYRIDRSFLQNLGIDVDKIDPRTIQIFSICGYSLPEDYTLQSNIGLKEIAIYVEGENDGKFDQSDYILLYGRNTEAWGYNTILRKITRIKHPYSKKSFYWLTYGKTNGKRMVLKPSLNITNPYKQQFTLSYYSYDKDSIKAGPSGREYYGDEFGGARSSRTYVTTLKGIVPESRINYNFRLINASTATVNYSISESNKLIYNGNISRIYDYYYGRADEVSIYYVGNLTDERSNLKITLNTTSAGVKVYLDYFEIEYRRKLEAANDYLLFFSKDTSSVIEYKITNFSNSNIKVFDITDSWDVKLIDKPSISGGEVIFQSNELRGRVSKYIAVNPNAYKTPVNAVAINLSDITSNISGSELIVISNKYFKNQVERYISYRANQSPYKLSTSVFYVDDIMNEFSGGLLDPTAIRNFLKYAYDSWTVKPIYVLLFGDGDYDYLNTVKETIDKNFVPTYQTSESLDEINSYVTDDYYSRVSGIDKKADLAIGRLPVQSIDDAESVVNKIIEYENNLEKGAWRYTITLVADDGPQAVGRDDGSLHTSQSENLAQKTIPNYFYLNKIYLAAYPTIYTGLGRRKPDVNKAIINSINNGTLLLNWIGHGNPNTWAHEYVFEKASTIPQLKNKNYFFLTAATCDFGKFDDPNEQSSTEIMVNMPNSGAIGAFTSARVVYADANAEINETFYNYLFTRIDENKLPNRVGMAFFLTKQLRTSVNDEKFHLFCDPTLRLNEPILSTSIDSINGQPIKSSIQISALSQVKISGNVKDSGYNGEAIISVYDSDKQVEFKDMNYTVTMPGGLIYRGRTTVNNGKFQTEFVVPKDISYENKNGKIIAYVYNDLNDGIGYTTDIIVGGTNQNAINDGKGPEIKIFFDKEDSENSYLVNPDFTLIVKLYDQTGINTTGTGIGHKLEGILNDDENNAIDFTNYFVGDLNSAGKSGVIRYKFTSMQPGDYKIKIKAWDVFNNFSSEETYFTVVSPEEGLTLRDIYNFPNPFSSNTTFTFQHNISSAIDVKIKIFTIAGRLVRVLEEMNITDKFVKLDWDGRDEDGNLLANGTYLYKLIVKSVDGKYNNTALGKLSIIR
ncbi:MAG: type IX secretion system sortase PorU [Melioribacter sp.]|nr:type IX secretion system sortase PorU [Melioribacter sp.]